MSGYVVIPRYINDRCTMGTDYRITLNIVAVRCGVLDFSSIDDPKSIVRFFATHVTYYDGNVVSFPPKRETIITDGKDRWARCFWDETHEAYYVVDPKHTETIDEDTRGRIAQAIQRWCVAQLARAPHS